MRQSAPPGPRLPQNPRCLRACQGWCSYAAYVVLVSWPGLGRGAGPDLREAALIWCQTRALVAHAMAEDARLAAEVAEAQLGTGLTVLRFSSEAMRHQAFRPRAVRW